MLFGYMCVNFQVFCVCLWFPRNAPCLHLLQHTTTHPTREEGDTLWREEGDTPGREEEDTLWREEGDTPWREEEDTPWREEGEIP